jgi:hypothetical protein
MERICKIPHRAGHAKEQAMVDVFTSFKHLPLSVTDFRSKSDYDRKSSSAQFEGK